MTTSSCQMQELSENDFPQIEASSTSGTWHNSGTEYRILRNVVRMQRKVESATCHINKRFVLCYSRPCHILETGKASMLISLIVCTGIYDFCTCARRGVSTILIWMWDGSTVWECRRRLLGNNLQCWEIAFVQIRTVGLVAKKLGFITPWVAVVG